MFSVFGSLQQYIRFAGEFSFGGRARTLWDGGLMNIFVFMGVAKIRGGGI